MIHQCRHRCSICETRDSSSLSTVNFFLYIFFMLIFEFSVLEVSTVLAFSCLCVWFQGRALTNGKASILRSSTPPATPKKRNHVRIREDSPERNGRNGHMVNDLTRTPPPMSLSDEEFRKRFLPQTPQNGDMSMSDAVE